MPKVRQQFDIHSNVLDKQAELEKRSKVYSTEKIKDITSNVKKGTVMTSDIFDVYVDKDRYMKNYDSKIDTLVSEMEGAILYCISKHLNKKAACILTVVDSMYEKIELSSHDREQALDQMITVALDTVIE